MTPFAIVPAGPITEPDDLSMRQAGVAACVLDALDDEEAGAALGLNPVTVSAIVSRLQQRTGTRNRVGLALRLQELAA